MATVARIDGIKIQFYGMTHPPAHFHAEYGECRAKIASRACGIIKGYLPNAQLRKVRTWAKPRKDQLLTAWMRCLSDLHPGKIA